MKEFDIVVLQQDLPEKGLKAGDIGTVVHKYGKSGAVEAEFVTGQGSTIGVITLQASEFRLMKGHEIMHVRKIHAA
ncbi:MAG: DUF4926 domain-containing protein [Desulfobacterales bacterium]|nr:DUF4926 domain-containing protein [Desulfobacterales bacterium]